MFVYLYIYVLYIIIFIYIIVNSPPQSHPTPTPLPIFPLALLSLCRAVLRATTGWISVVITRGPLAFGNGYLPLPLCALQS